MKRLALTISLILTVVLTLSFSYASHVVAAKPVPPSVQMLSTSYTLPVPSTLTIVETLSFSVANPAKLEVTSVNTAFSGGTAGCEIVLDTLILVSNSLNTAAPDLTVTDTSVAVGSHTLTVHCSSPAGTTLNGSVSAVITTGL